MKMYIMDVNTCYDRPKSINVFLFFLCDNLNGSNMYNLCTCMKNIYSYGC